MGNPKIMIKEPKPILPLILLIVILGLNSILIKFLNKLFILSPFILIKNLISFCKIKILQEILEGKGINKTNGNFILYARLNDESFINACSL